jgi:hypothetical protein
VFILTGFNGITMELGGKEKLLIMKREFFHFFDRSHMQPESSFGSRFSVKMMVPTTGLSQKLTDLTNTVDSYCARTHSQIYKVVDQSKIDAYRQSQGCMFSLFPVILN